MIPDTEDVKDLPALWAFPPVPLPQFPRFTSNTTLGTFPPSSTKRMMMLYLNP